MAEELNERNVQNCQTFLQQVENNIKEKIVNDL